MKECDQINMSRQSEVEADDQEVKLSVVRMTILEMDIQENGKLRYNDGYRNKPHEISTNRKFNNTALDSYMVILQVCNPKDVEKYNIPRVITYEADELRPLWTSILPYTLVDVSIIHGSPFYNNERGHTYTIEKVTLVQDESTLKYMQNEVYLLGESREDDAK